MRKLFITLSILSAILFIFFTVYFFQQESRRVLMPVLGEVADFQLTDSQGNKFLLANLKDKVWVASFIFTTCSDICPVMSKNIAALHRTFHMEKDIQFVSFTVNPEFDSPKVLSEYAKKYNADTSQWHFLTGDREKIQEISVKSFKIGSIEEPIFHSSYLVLVDRNGNIRGYFDGTHELDIRKLFKATAQLLKSK